MNLDWKIIRGFHFRLVGSARQLGAGLFFFLAGIGLFCIGRLTGKHDDIMLMGMGALFAGIGLLALLLKFFKISEASVDLIMGVLGGALFSVPATLILPGQIYLYFSRPNFFYSADVTSLPLKDFLLGALFSSVGLLVNVFLIWILNRRGRSGLIKTRYGNISVGGGDPAMRDRKSGSF